MELHSAIRGIIKMQGQDFVLKPCFINALDDFNAFEQNPALKNVLRIAISDGYINKLIAFGDWNLKSQSLANELVRSYAVDQAICLYIFESMAYGLGYISKEPQFVSTQGVSNTPAPPSPKEDYLRKTPKDFAIMTNEEFTQYVRDVQDYLDSIVIVKGDWKKELGPQFTIFSEYSAYRHGDNHIRFRIEVNGQVLLIDYSWINFIGVLYDSRGRIVGRSKASLYKDKCPPFQVVETMFFDNNAYQTVADIKKVVFYWEKV